MDTAGEFLVAKVQEHLAPPDFSLVDEFLLRVGEPRSKPAVVPDMRMLTPGWCFRNAWALVRESSSLRYGEGYCLARNGEFVQHAWAITDQGFAIDPTIPYANVHDYFGVVFDRQDYLRWVGQCPPDQGVLFSYGCSATVIRFLRQGQAPVLLFQGFAGTLPEK